MKAFLTAIVLFAVFNIRSVVAETGDSLENQFIRQIMERSPNQTLLGIQPQKPNEIKFGGLSYSGILVELAKTDNPFQLINPAASAEYGSPEDNIVRDPINGRISGLKLFAISF